MFGMWDVWDVGCCGCGMWNVVCRFTKCPKYSDKNSKYMNLLVNDKKNTRKI